MRLKQGGFSLTELMVTVGILGIVIVIILSGGQLLFKSAVTTERGQEVTALMYEAMSILGNPSLCSAAIVGRTAAEGTEIIIAPEIQAGASYAGKVKVSSVALGSIQELSGNSRKAEVFIKGETTGETLGSKNFSRALTAFFVVDNDNVMQRCLGEAYDIGESCRALGGSWQFLSNRCDFCGTLGGMWSDGICVLDPLKQKCTPVTEVIAGESIGGGVGYDRCDQWKQPWINDAAKFLEVSLPAMPRVNATDVANAKAAADEFMRQVASFTECRPQVAEVKASIGPVSWHLKGQADDCDKTSPGTPRCAVVLRFDVNICN